MIGEYAKSAVSGYTIKPKYTHIFYRIYRTRILTTSNTVYGRMDKRIRHII